MADQIHYIDSHTEGEPTRVVTTGGPTLSTGPLNERLNHLRHQADAFRQTVINEPRGWDALVGALLCTPHQTDCAAGVIFFNNTGYLGMCGHGTIGLAVTLHAMGNIELGRHQLDTPVGTVAFELLTPNRVAIENVPSFRFRKSVTMDVDGIGPVTGDIAWGGNWFFLTECDAVPLKIENLKELTQITNRIRQSLIRNNITGANGAEIDHIELFGPPVASDAHGRNFVLCPGGAYDRSPCGTGTSAKLACLAADGKLQPGHSWIQESIIGSRFEGSYRHADNDAIIPRIVGSAYLCAEGDLIQQPDDPFAHGIGSQA